MINNNITSHSRLIVDTMYANLQQWFAVHLFMLKQVFTCRRHYLVKQCVIDNHRAIVYRQGLAVLDQAYFNYLINFAYRFEIDLIEDRRVHHIAIKHERRKPSILLAFISVVVVSTSAIAGNNINHSDNSKQSIERQELTQLLSWVRFKMSQLEFEVGSELPSIERLPRSQMYKIAFGANTNRISSNQAIATVYGLYNYQNKTIYLLDSIDVTTTKGKAILLHELVHYLQYQNGHEHKVECKNKLEYLAYQLEAAYLKEHGEEVGFSQDHLRRVVQCRS